LKWSPYTLTAIIATIITCTTALISHYLVLYYRHFPISIFLPSLPLNSNVTDVCVLVCFEGPGLER
jgi:hypothetical protein